MRAQLDRRLTPGMLAPVAQLAQCVGDNTNPFHFGGRRGLCTELGAPHGFGGTHERFIFPLLEIHRHAPHRQLNAFGERAHGGPIVHIAHKIIPREWLADNHMRLGAKGIAIAKNEPHGDNREIVLQLGRGADRHPRGPGLERGESGCRVRDALGEEPDHSARGQHPVDVPEGVEVLGDEGGVVLLPVHRDRADPPHQPADQGVRE